MRGQDYHYQKRKTATTYRILCHMKVNSECGFTARELVKLLPDLHITKKQLLPLLNEWKNQGFITSMYGKEFWRVKLDEKPRGNEKVWTWGEEKFILDACCGGRTFWFNKNHPNTLYIDNRVVSKGTSKLRPNFEVRPDVVMDFRALDFPDGAFKLVVWDPPHLKSLGKTSEMRKKYGCLNAETWRYDLKKGFDECWRVLDDMGILIFKWNSNEISTKQVLKLLKVQPLFGHPSGSKSKTKWFCFMKIPKRSEVGEKNNE